MSETAPAIRPKRLRRPAAADYLKEVHGIDIEEKTLANRNSAGLGPKPEYLGTLPYYRVDELDAWAETAFTPESPVAVTRRQARAAALACHEPEARAKPREAQAERMERALARGRAKAAKPDPEVVPTG
jgi:hypothetical protein